MQPEVEQPGAAHPLAAGKRARSWNAINARIVACARCVRLRNYCREVAERKKPSFADWTYWGRPVPNFGDPAARLLIVGLAPAAHGANRTGRMFTGDRSGDFLFASLHRTGFANQPTGRRPDDGLRLIDCAIAATAHCAPPDNKPTPTEIANCRPWLEESFDLIEPRAVVALGQIAWQAIVIQLRRNAWYAGPAPRFAHGAKIRLAGDRWLLGSYHPSQQNTFTGRLTTSMLDNVFIDARGLLAGSSLKRSHNTPPATGA